MKFTKKELQKVVKGYNSTNAAKAAVPILAAIKLEQDANKRTATITDMETELFFTFEGGGEAELALIPGDAIKAAAKAIKATDELEITRADGDKVEIKYNGICKTIEIFDIEEYPAGIKPLDQGLEIKDAAFFDKLENCFNYSSRDETRYALQSVLLESDSLVSTDGRRLLRAETCKLKLGIKSNIIIPATARKALRCLDKKTIKYINAADIPGKIAIQFSDQELTVKFDGLNGAYPNYGQAIPSEKGMENFLVFGACDIDKLQAIANGLNRRELNSSHFNFRRRDDGRVSLASPHQEPGIDCPLDDAIYTLDDEIVLNIDFLIDSAKAGILKYKIKDPRTPLRGTSGDYMTVIMPLKKR